VKGFSFRLQRLLRVRELEEQAARERWALHERETQAARTQAEAARQAKHDAWQKLRSKADRPLQRLALEQTLPGLDQRLQSCRDRLDAAQQRAESERRAWVQERARVQSLERLKERDAAQFRADALQRENAILDEVASGREARKAAADSADENKRGDEQ
jgi:flagellar FliJ protein